METPAQIRLERTSSINELTNITIPVRNDTREEAIRTDSVRTGFSISDFLANEIGDKSTRPESNSSKRYHHPDRASVEKELRIFKRACIELKQICVVCMVQRGVNRSTDKCETDSQPCLKSRCYRCFQSRKTAKLSLFETLLRVPESFNQKIMSEETIAMHVVWTLGKEFVCIR